MKHILFVEGIKTEEDVNKIKAVLENTRAEFTVSLISSSVTIVGSNDVLNACKSAITNIGFVIL